MGGETDPMSQPNWLVAYLSVQYWALNFEVFIRVRIYVSAILLGGSTCSFFSVKISGIAQQLLVFKRFWRREVFAVQVDELSSHAIRWYIQHQEFVIDLVLSDQKLVSREDVPGGLDVFSA